MAYDFPSSPSVGQVITGPNGIQYVWDGVKWVAAGATNTGQTFAPYGTVNNVGRNLIHNPLFNIQQRGTGPWTTVGAFTADRWLIDLNTDTVSVTVAALSDAQRAQIGDEAATWALQNNFTGNAAAGAYNNIIQRIEGVRRLAGKTVTVSFWAWCGAGALKLGVNIAQSFGTGGSPSAALWVLTTGASVTLSTTATRYSVTIPIPSVAGKTLGTNNNDNTQLTMWCSSGATSNTTAGNIGVQSGAIAMWGVQLEIGAAATPLEKPDPQQDLAKCQRFFLALTGAQAAVTPAAGGTYTCAMIVLPTPMRATPVATPFGQVYGNASALGLAVITNQTVQVSITATAVGNAYCSYNVTFSADL